MNARSRFQSWFAAPTNWGAICVALAPFLGGQDAAGSEVVFGSFVRSEAAEEFRDRVESTLGVDAGIVGVEVGGVRYLRVSAGSETAADARALIATARRAGYPDAWYLAAPVVRRQMPDEPETTPASEASTAVAAPEAVAAPVEAPDPEPVEEVGVPPVEKASHRFAGALSFAVSPDGGEAIAVPRYDNVDIRFDGRPDEAVWAEVTGYDNMVLVQPGTLAKARHRTVARYLHTADGIYIGVWNEQPRRTLTGNGGASRSPHGHDTWGITLDTSGDGRRGHWFSITLGTTDGVNEPGGSPGAREPRWQYATAALRDGWSLEAFLPWSALSLPATDEDRVVGMYVNRNVAYLKERWGWPASLTPTRDTAGR